MRKLKNVVLALLMCSGAGAATFRNPVLDANFPDPFVLRAGSGYYAYATNSSGLAIQLATSSDLVHWTVQGDALAGLPAWSTAGLTWAPEVMKVGAHYRLYYTTHDAASDRQCLSVASADSPAGPFTDVSTKPLVCQAALGGSIDPSPFMGADGQRYLLFKNDGNCCGLTTSIYIQKLSADGLKVLGTPTALIHNDPASWEGRVIEAPTLHFENGVYYLLYSGGPFDSDRYAVGYATAKKVTGPYTKFAGNPLVKSRGQVAGPGHQALIQDGAGRWWLAYHAWTAGATNDSVGERTLRLDPIRFAGGRMIFGGVTLSPQPSPALPKPTQRKP